jgi:hypothetical protein
MKTLIALSALLALAGCATTGENMYAKNECTVAPITTASATGVRKPQPDSLDQRYAEMQLGTSDYRYRNLRQNGYNMNNVEDALRDCNAAR